MLHADDRRTVVQSDEARRLCRQFSKFFMDKLRRIAVEISQRLSASRLQPVPPPVMSAHLPMLQDFEQVTMDEVAKLIWQLPPKSSLMDCLPAFLMKTTVDVMAPALARLANLSFLTGVFPPRYKLRHVAPLLKKPGLCSTDPANYRPVTNLATFSKILEKLALNRMRPHVLSSGRLNMYQLAYRPGHSTETALLKVVGDIQRAAGDGKCTVLLAFDISAAFDAVDHSVLGACVNTDFAISDTVGRWIRVLRRRQVEVHCDRCGEV